MDAVKPSPLPPGYIQAVMIAWSGGIYDVDRERLVVWGGGHGDYAGNEVYAFGPLTSDTPRWERLTNPSVPWAENTSRASDGRPVSRHTYNYITYLPAPHNKMMSCTVGAQYSNGFGGGGVDFYDFTVNGMTGQPWSIGPTAPNNEYSVNTYCIYNPSTNSVFYQSTGSGNSQLQEYSLTTRTWTSHLRYDPASHATPAVDTKRNLIVTTGSDHGLQVYNPANPKVAPLRVTSSGPKAIEAASFPGFAYDSANDQFVGWSGGSALYTLKAPADPKTGTWVWSQLALDAGNIVTPTAPAGVRHSGYVIGTFGRFRYVPSQKGVVVVNSTDENVYFFKLGGGTSSAPLPTISFTASPTSVASQGTSTLTWSTSNAASCSAAGAWSGTKATSGSEARGPLSANSTFTLTCANSAGNTASRSVSVSVVAATPAPTVDLNANPTSVAAGGGTSLSWTTSNASSCTASNGWSGSKAVSGSENIAAVNQQTTYTLTCTGAGGTQADSVTVAVAPAPVVTLTSSSNSVASGSNVTLNWSATNATGCTANGAWAGSKAVSGSQSVGPLSASSTFGLSCSGSGGSNSRSVTVDVTSTTPTGRGPLASAVASRWYQFASSRMDAMVPSPLPAGYLAAVMLAWSGGVYDTDRERLVIWGGGGSDYAGNEVYAFGPLTSDTPRWERLTDPSAPAANNVIRGADGRPVSRHTYGLLTYLPAPHNKMMSCSVGGQYSNGYGVGGVDFYDFTINGKTGQPWSAGPTAPSNEYPYNSYCIYDSGSNSVFYQDNGSNGSSLQQYSLTTNTWTKHVGYNPGSEPTPAVDTKRKLIVTTGQYHGVQIYDPASPKTLPVRVATSGPKVVEDGRFPGFIYDPVNDQFIGWNGGAAIYALKPPAAVRSGAWVWSQLALDSGSTVTPTAVAGVRHVGYPLGTYGRFRYVPSLHGVVLANAVDESVYFFKLPGGSTPAPVPAPTISLAASPTSVAAQGSSTLTWSTSNAASCSAAGAWTGAKATAGSEVRGPLTTDSTFTLTCANSTGGTANRSVTVSVAPPAAAPTVSLTPSGAISLLSGSTINYTWTSTNATSCTATAVVGANTIVEAKPTSGTQTIGPLVSNTSVRLACTGAGGSAEATSTVTIVPQPTVTLSATPTTIASGSSTAVTWSSTNATACLASGAWSGNRAVSGSEPVTLSQSGTLTLTCNNLVAQVTKDVVITVEAPAPTPTPPPAGAALVNDGPATPEQISMFIPSSLPLTATATVRYRQVGVTAWTIGHALHRIRPDFSDTPAPAGGFAWVITDLKPGTPYEVEVTIANGADTTVRAGVITTRALPIPAGSANKVIAAGSTAAQIQTVFNNANPGDVIQFANGIHTVNDLQLNRSGTAASPIYIRGESRNGAILRDGSGVILRLLAASHIVFENLTLEGSKVDSGTNASSVGISFYNVTSPTQINVTVRNMTFDGVDQGVVGDSDIRQVLVYDNVFRGNNQWGQDLYSYGGGGTPGAGDGVLDLEQNLFWNDDGVRLPGFGHAVFNNTFTGFGDTLAVCSHAGGSATASCATSHFYRNDIRMTGDDAIEVDYGIRNITFYDNRVHNSATFISLDPLFGGPFIASRNISINTTRGPFKFNSPNSGHFIYNNTVVRTTGTNGVAGATSAEAGWYQPNNGPQRGFGYQNNLLIYRGSGTQTIRLDNPGYGNFDFSHNSWYPNAIFQWPESNYANLAAAFANLPATTPLFSSFTKRHQNDNISEVDPFATDIVLGANYRSRVTTLYTPILSPGSAPANNGVVIPNVTDGFSGAAPDRGAIITGRSLPQWGDRTAP
jgi:hypothetical protein